MVNPDQESGGGRTDGPRERSRGGKAPAGAATITWT